MTLPSFKANSLGAACIGAASAGISLAVAGAGTGHSRASVLVDDRRAEMTRLIVALKRVDQLTSALADPACLMAAGAVTAAAFRAERAYELVFAALSSATIDLDVVADEPLVLELLAASDLDDMNALRGMLAPVHAEAARIRAALRKILTGLVNGPDADLAVGSPLEFWMAIRSELASNVLSPPASE